MSNMPKKLEELTVKELQEMMVKLGMPEEAAKTFKAKAPAIATINTLRAKEAVESDKPQPAKADEPVKKVATIIEPRNPAEERQINKRWFGKAKIMRDKLMKQLETDPVSIIIPLMPGEKRGVVEWRVDDEGEKYQVKISGDVATPQLNGFIFMVPKGVYYQVPKQVAELIAASEQQTLTAGDHMSMDRIHPETGKPVREAL